MSIIPAPFLRQALMADATTSAACGVLMALGAAFLEPMLGLPAQLLRTSGVILLPYAALLAYLAMRETVPRVAVWAIILGNVLWAADSALLLASGWIAPTNAGYTFVLAQAVVVLMYAELQFIGLRRSTAIAA
ncbi:hypothetical protein AB4072_02710 [Microvirga sp. 2MCAF38]|uniref:hypothetical protein n=1 Tax=Microvirga sp. 2MCAF38 TaxID=3232989 RepID=UPI003F94924D